MKVVRGRRRGVELTPAAATDYVSQIGGRLCDMPGPFLDRIADALRDAHPETLPRDLVIALTGQRFARSRHPLLRDLQISEVRMRYRDMDARFSAARRRVSQSS